LNRTPTNVIAHLWLGPPEAGQFFDATKLNDTDRDRLASLNGEHRRREFAVSRALRHAALGDSSDPSSLSHSGGWAAVARGTASCRIGVDLELHRPRNLLGIARFAFDAAETAMLESLAGLQQHEAFYALWTMKESMAKALGLPLLVASRQCVFLSDAPTDATAWRGSAPTDRPWLIQVFRPRAGMALCIAVIGRNDPDAIATWEWPPMTPGEWPRIATVRDGDDP
jgi:hypothetical protein